MVVRLINIPSYRLDGQTRQKFVSITAARCRCGFEVMGAIFYLFRYSGMLYGSVSPASLAKEEIKLFTQNILFTSMTKFVFIKRIRSFRLFFSWAEFLLIFGLVLINIGCFLSPVTFDKWLAIIVLNLDVRDWTWRSFGVLMILSVFFFAMKFRQRWRLVIVAVFTFLTIYDGMVEFFSKEYPYQTIIIRQRPKGVPVINEKSLLDYKVHLPPCYDIGRRCPLVIFLHGAGCVNKDIDDVNEDMVNCLPSKSKRDFPFVIICPASGQHGWHTPQILQIVEEAKARWHVDPNRIYLTGMSMGGFGTFRIASELPETFAAIIPLCGGCEPPRAKQLKNVPTWAFHGDADNVVRYENSWNIIEAMKKADCKEAKLTTLHGAGHGITNDVYSRPEIYRWLLDKKKL
jgi:dienelactone hydrolase